MMKPGKLLPILLMACSLITKSSSAATSDELAKACDLALNAKVQEAQLCNLGVQLRTDEMARINAENAKLQDRGSAWYSNPFIWAAVGVIVGAYAGARATR